MQTQSKVRAKQASLALLFLTIRLPTFGKPLPSLGAPRFQSPPWLPAAPCLSQTEDGYTFDFLGYRPNGDGTTSLSFRVTTVNQKEISYLAFGTGVWTPVAPSNTSMVTGGLGAYHVEWTNHKGNPGFPSIKFETQFTGFSQGKLETFTVTVASFDPNQPMTIEVKAGREKTRVTLVLDDPACNLTPPPTPTPTATATPVSPLPTPTATPEQYQPEFTALYPYIVQAQELATTLPEAHKQALWNRGLPIPDVATSLHNVFELAAAPAGKPGLLSLAPAMLTQPDIGGWSTLYHETFDSGLPAPSQNGACRLFYLTSDAQYQWGADAHRTYENSSGAAWPPAGGAGGGGLQPGVDPYPANLTSQLVCVLENLSDAAALMVEFALWLDQGNDGDTFFVGFSTDGQTFQGRRWRKTPDDGTGQPTWTRNRLFFPEVAASSVANGGKVAILWEFRSNGMVSAAQGSWLDEITIERKESAQVLCEDQDPRITVTGAPGDGRVSKGVNYDPYVRDDLLNTHVNNLSASGVQWVRLEFKVQPAVRQALAGLPEGTGALNIDTRFYDNVIGHLCSTGTGVLGLVDYESLTDRRWEETEQVDDAYLDAFANVTQMLVNRYLLAIRYWEIWNEPDFKETRLQPASYGQLLRRAYDTVKATDSDDVVLHGGLGGADQTMHDAYFLELVDRLDAVSPRPFDIFAIHPYPSGDYRAGNGSVLVDPLSYLPYEPPSILKKFMDGLTSIGVGNRPIWVTELGWNRAKDSTSENTKSCALINQTMVSGVEQAIYLYRGFDFLFKRTAWDSGAPSVQKVFWYQYMDVGRNVPEAQCATATQAASSWYGSYSALFAEPAAPQRLVDWWFGLYSGTDGTTPLPVPHDSACTFQHYPDERTLFTCLTHVYLPVVTGGADATTTSQ